MFFKQRTNDDASISYLAIYTHPLEKVKVL